MNFRGTSPNLVSLFPFQLKKVQEKADVPTKVLSKLPHDSNHVMEDDLEMEDLTDEELPVDMEAVEHELSPGMLNLA